MQAYDKENVNRTWDALKIVGKSLPDLFRNYNELLALNDWTPEQEKTFKDFVFDLVLIVRTLQASTMRTTNHAWKKCTEVLETFELAIKENQPIPEHYAIELNKIFQQALMEWDAEMN